MTLYQVCLNCPLELSLLQRSVMTSSSFELIDCPIFALSIYHANCFASGWLTDMIEVSLCLSWLAKDSGIHFKTRRSGWDTLGGGTTRFSEFCFSGTFFALVSSFLVGFCQTRYQCDQTSPLYKNIKKNIFPHYDVIGESPKINWKFFENFFYKKKLSRPISCPICINDPPIKRGDPWAENVGSGFFDFCHFWGWNPRKPQNLQISRFLGVSTPKTEKIEKSTSNVFSPRVSSFDWWVV